MNKYIVTVFNRISNELTTVEMKCNNLADLEIKVSEVFNGWGKITAIIVTNI